MKTVRLVCCYLLILMSLATFALPGIAMAQTETAETVPDAIDISATYPRMEAVAGSTFSFEVEFRYTSEARFEPREFLLSLTAPQGWDVYMTPQYQKDQKLSAIQLTPSLAYGDKILVHATAPFWPLPDVGEYPIELTATSKDGQLKTTVQLTAVITAKYYLALAPVNQQYNTNAKTGKDNIFSMKLNSLSTAPVENVNFSATSPEGWLVTFSPEKVEKIEPMSSQTVDVNIKPPDKTIAGDYVITISAKAAQTSAQDVEIRVTAETPTIWGWVGVAIILLIVAGLVLIFMRFSRR